VYGAAIGQLAFKLVTRASVFVAGIYQGLRLQGAPVRGDTTHIAQGRNIGYVEGAPIAAGWPYQFKALDVPALGAFCCLRSSVSSPARRRANTDSRDFAEPRQ